MLMESIAGKKKSTSLLAPGFRFHPTDEELVRYYLRRKIFGKSFRFDAISEVDVYKSEPWDLPYKSKLKTRDLEWYFFSVLDKKYGNGARTNRATEKGYWKTTGKDRAVYHRTKVSGMKKTLVYHSRRAPKGQRTNWVMHEYRLTDVDFNTAGITQKDAFVLCRIFQKSGSGPKNGEQYGAPFVEEEWDNDELESLPEDEAKDEVDFGGDAFLDAHDLQQILQSDVPPITAPLSGNLIFSDGSYGEENTSAFNHTKNLSVCAGNQYNDGSMYNLPASCDMELVKQESYGECSKSGKSGNSEELDFLLDEPFFDSSDNLLYGNEGFIEANDFLSPVENDNSAFDMLNEYLSFDANDDNSLYFANDSASIFGTDGLVSEQPLLPHKEMTEETEQAILPNGQHIGNNNNNEVSPSDKQESAKHYSGSEYPFIKQASKILGNLPAPPAFAAEFPSKNAILRLNGAKDENFNVIVSFGYSRGNDGSSNLESSVRIQTGKAASAMSRSWLFFVFVFVIFFSMTFKYGTYLCAN
ncbi:hypothetical protein ABFS83_06G162600 [Erythranthe nasuta]